jgi:hypothetical protein
MLCGQVTDSCYQETSPQQPRPCPAQEKGFEGCTCTEEVCAQRCRLTTPRDPEARLIHYTGSNQDGEEDPSRARNVYGYRSYAKVICDDELHTYWVTHASVQTATADERKSCPGTLSSCANACLTSSLANSSPTRLQVIRSACTRFTMKASFQ